MRLSDSELLRCIRRIRKSEYSPEHLKELLDERGIIFSKKDKKEYRKNIKNLISVLEGEKKSVLNNLKREMAEASKIENFERAGEIIGGRQVFFFGCNLRRIGV